MSNSPSHLWPETPLLHSPHISEIIGCPAYLKLDNLQPSQSYKYRGASLFAQHCKQTHGDKTHLVIASGGNAGIAAASAAKILGLRCTVYLPEGATESMLSVLKKQGANVVVSGRYYLHALQQARLAVRNEPDAVMVPAYDDPILWEGHSSMIDEISKQLPCKPQAIFCSVGGGGLLGGIIVGCKRAGWDDVPIMALETNGCNCFYHSMSVNPGQFNAQKQLSEGIEIFHDEVHDVDVAHLNTLTSKASSLAASSPSPGVVKMALQRQGPVKCISVPDELSMQTACRFADDHKFITELACSTTLTPAYKPELFDKLVTPPRDPEQQRAVVFIVCGGFKISVDEMTEYRQAVDTDLKKGGSDKWEVLCNGEKVYVNKSW